MTEQEIKEKTLRDEMAMAALTGICANPKSNEYYCDDIAMAAYKHADAMMKAREGNYE